MTPEQAMYSAIDQAARQLAPGSGSDARWAVEYAGGTRALATELGVSIRTVQRWLKYESGQGEGRNPQRSPQAGPLNAMAQAAKDEAAMQALAEAEEIYVEADDVDLEYAGHNEGTRQIPPESMPDDREWIELFRAGDRVAAAQSFTSAMLEARGIPTALTVTGIGAVRLTVQQ